MIITQTMYCMVPLVVIFASGYVSNTLSAHPESDCIYEYPEFEKKTFIDNSQNKHKLYKAFYPPNGHLPYSVVVKYQTVLPNGTSAYILTNGSNYVNEEWIWLSSPVFVFSRPEFLNKVILFTLNNFKNLDSPEVVLQVPYPCPNMTFDFLLEMTTSVQDYALGELEHKTHSGITLIKSIEQNAFYRLPIEESNFHSVRIENEHYTSALIIAVGGIFQLLLIWMVAIALLKLKLLQCVDRSHSFSYEHYGLMCGITVMSAFLVVVIVSSHISIVDKLLPRDTRDRGPFILYLAGMGLCFLPGIPIATYFAYKYKPPPIPYMFLLPVTALLCCCSTKRAKSIIFGLALLFIMVALQCIGVTAMIIMFAILAEPFTVITNTLVAILVIFCFTNTLASIFTISAYLFTPKNLRSKTGNSLFRVIVLIPLLVMVSCYCFTLSSGGFVINVDTKQGNVRSMIGSAILPLILGLITIGLKTLISRLMDTTHKNEWQMNTCKEDELDPLLTDKEQ